MSEEERIEEEPEEEGRGGGDQVGHAADDAGAAAPPLREAADGRPYRVTMWKGRPNYECLECPFATLAGVGAILAHVAERHRPRRPETTAAILTPRKRVGRVRAMPVEKRG